MKVLLDTNIWVAAYASKGLCLEVVDLARRGHEIILCEQIPREFEKALVRKLGFPAVSARQEAGFLRQSLRVLPDPRAAPSRSRDPSDNAILQCALLASCGCLVTGDEDLVVLQNVEGMPILRPRDFLRIAA